MAHKKDTEMLSTVKVMNISRLSLVRCSRLEQVQLRSDDVRIYKKKSEPSSVVQTQIFKGKVCIK